MGEVVVKAGVDLKLRDVGLDHLDQLPGVVHAGDGVLHADDVGMDLGQGQHGLRGDGVAGVVREVVDVDVAVDLLGQPVIVLQQGGGVKVEIVGGQDHDGVGACVQAEVGKADDLVRHHVAGADDQLHPVIHRFDGEFGHLPALVHGHGEELTAAALHQDAVHALVDQVVEEPLLADQVQGAVLVEEGDGRRQICCVHSIRVLLNRVRGPEPRCGLLYTRKDAGAAGCMDGPAAQAQFGGRPRLAEAAPGSFCLKKRRAG